MEYNAESIKTVLDMNTEDLIMWLWKNFYFQVPESVQTIPEADYAAKLLSRYANSHAFLMSLLSYLKAATRNKKKEDKESYEKLMAHRDAVDNFAAALRLQYQATSRMITIRSDNNEELHMSDNYTDCSART